MPTNNFKLFDENKANLLTDTEYGNSTQRLNGVQTGVASSQLNNKFAYQVSLVAYAIAQLMNANGQDASDTLAVSAFVGNLQGAILQKVADKATSAEAAAGVLSNKYITPETMKAAALLLSGGVMNGVLDMGNNRITNLGTPTADSDAVTKGYVDGNTGFNAYKKNLLFEHTFDMSLGQSERLFNFTIPNVQEIFKSYSGILFYFKLNNVIASSGTYGPLSLYLYSETKESIIYEILGINQRAYGGSGIDNMEIYYLSLCNETKIYIPYETDKFPSIYLKGKNYKEGEYIVLNGNLSANISLGSISSSVNCTVEVKMWEF